MSGKNLLISDYLLFGGNFCDQPGLTKKIGFIRKKFLHHSFLLI